MLPAPFPPSLFLVAISSFFAYVTAGAPSNSFLYPNDQELPTYYCQDSIDVSWTSEYASASLVLCTKAPDNTGSCGEWPSLHYFLQEDVHLYDQDGINQCQA